LKHIFFFIN